MGIRLLDRIFKLEQNATSVSDGLMLGVISYTAINSLSGRFRRVHWIMYVLTALFIAKYALM